MWGTPHAQGEPARPASPPAPATRLVTGRILDANGAPASEASVRLVGVPGFTLPIATAGDGRFRLAIASGTKARILAEHAAGLVESAELTLDGSYEVVLVLEPAVEISGRVVDDRGGPVARATIKLHSELPPFERIVWTDEHGAYSVRARSVAGVSLSASARGFAPRTARLAGNEAGAMEIRLAPLPSLRGVVRDPWGKPVSGAEVTACEGDDAERAISDAAGAFELPANVVGCKATARHRKFSDAQAVTVGARGNVVLRLLPGGAIVGMALDEVGRPVEPASVDLSFVGPLEGSGEATAEAGQTRETLHGGFRFDDLAPGTYVLTASMPGRANVSTPPIRVLPGRVVRGVALTFAPATPPGEPMEEAVVTPAEEAPAAAVEQEPAAPPEEAAEPTAPPEAEPQPDEATTS
jgi:hypothetical protein